MNLPTSIENALQNASFDQKKKFGVAICTKLKENYRIFSEKYEFGSVAIFEEILETIQQKDLKINPEIIDSQIDKICPDMEEFAGYFWASLALDACSALGELAFFYASEDEKAIRTISYLSIQSTEFQILEQEKWNQNLPDLKQKLESHPLFLKEIDLQLSLF